jgi:hypothetical protein
MKTSHDSHAESNSVALSRMRPKPRYKPLTSPQENREPARIIVPIESNSRRQPRLKKSGQPFQVWRAPEDYCVRLTPPPKPSLLTAVREALRAYIREALSVSFSHFRHSH